MNAQDLIEDIIKEADSMDNSAAVREYWRLVAAYLEACGSASAEQVRAALALADEFAAETGDMERRILSLAAYRAARKEQGWATEKSSTLRCVWRKLIKRS